MVRFIVGHFVGGQESARAPGCSGYSDSFLSEPA